MSGLEYRADKSVGRRPICLRVSVFPGTRDDDLVDPLQLLVAVEVKLDATAAFLVLLDPDLGAQLALQGLLCGDHIGVSLRRRSDDGFLPGTALRPGHDALGLPDRDPAAGDFVRQVDLQPRTTERRKRLGVTERQSTVADVFLDLGRKGEQSKQIRDRRALLADAVRDFLLSQPQVVDEGLESKRRLQRVQLLALDVLDQRDLEKLIVADVAYQSRDLEQAGTLRSTPAALTDDQLVFTIFDRAYDDRLDDALSLQRLGELFQGRFVEILAGLVTVGAYPVQVDLARPGLRFDGLRRNRVG